VYILAERYANVIPGYGELGGIFGGVEFKQSFVWLHDQIPYEGSGQVDG